MYKAIHAPVSRWLLGLGLLLFCQAILVSVGGAQVPPEEPVCRNCAEGLYYGNPVHYWVGTAGCEPGGGGGTPIIPLAAEPGCKQCFSEHCDEPLVPHGGDCPDEACEGDGGVNLMVAYLLGVGSTDWAAAALRAAGVEVLETPGGVGALDCRGRVMVFIPRARFPAMRG